MKRKLIKQGNNAYTLTLPIKWVKHFNLKPGQEIDVEEEHADLVVHATGAKAEKKEKIIDINKNNEKFLRLLLVNAYRNGYDRIVMNLANAAQVKNIKDFKNQLIGFDITSINKNQVILENITEPTEEKFETLLNRIMFIYKETANVIAEDIKKNKYENTVQINQMNTDVSSYAHFCRRIIIKKLLKNVNPYPFYHFLSFVTLIQHSFQHMYDHLIKLNTKVSKESQELFDDVRKMLDEFVEAFLKKDIDLVGKIHAKRHLYEKAFTLMQKKSKESIFLYYCTELIRLLDLAANPMIGILIS